MRTLVVVTLALVACSKKDRQPATRNGSAVPLEPVTCDVAAKEYTTKMAATPGNVLSDAEPDEVLLGYTRVAIEDYCIGEGGMVIAWTPAEKACVKAAANSSSAVSACFVGQALAQVNAGLTEVVAKGVTKRANEASAGSAK